MDIDDCTTSNVDVWLALFTSSSHTNAFPFTPHKLQSIESRRALMSDLLLFDVLLIRGGIRTPDMLFPPSDYAALRKLLEAIDRSVYDRLKKDCLVYILLKWAWDTEGRDTNAGWETRFVEERCIPPQFVSLANAYWLLDTGSNLTKAVSILCDARLNRDYVSKILQAISLSSCPAFSATGPSTATAALIVKYIRTAKPPLTEPDDVDLYVLSLAQVSFMDAWAYQRTFSEESQTRERLLSKIVAWCLMPKPKQAPLAQLVAFPLAPYEESLLHTLASTSTSLASTTTPPVVLSPQAITTLQDLVCVRAIQAGNYTRAIKLDRQFSSVPSSISASGAASTSTSQPSMGSGSRENTERKAMMQDLLGSLPPAERTLLEEEIGRVATGVRAPVQPLAPRPSLVGRRVPLGDLSMSWEDVESPRASVSGPGRGEVNGVSTSPALSGVGVGIGASPSPARFDAGLSSAQARTGRTGRTSIGSAPPAQAQAATQSPSPFSTLAPRTSGFTSRLSHTAATVALVGGTSSIKFTAFGTPLPSAAGMTSSNAISEPGKTIFHTTTSAGASTGAKSTRTSLFETSGSAKHAPNAFYNPPPVPTPTSKEKASFGMEGSLAGVGTGTGVGTGGRKQHGKEEEEDGEDASMGSGCDSEVDDHGRSDDGQEEAGDEVTDGGDDGNDPANFITHDTTAAADLTISLHEDEGEEERGAGAELGFSVFGGKEGRSVRSRGNGSGSGRTSYLSSPSHDRIAPRREADASLSLSANSSTTKRRAPPGAFHAEADETEDEDEDQHGSGVKPRAQTRTTQTTLPRRRLSTGPQTQPQHTSVDYSHSQSYSQARQVPSRGTKNTVSGGRPSTRRNEVASKLSGVSLNQSIPGSLVDDDDEHENGNDYDYSLRGDEPIDTEAEQDEEEDDDIAPLPARPSRRTRSGLATTTTSTLKHDSFSKTSTKTKAKAKGKPSEQKTPPRRSSRLSTASSVASLSPDHTDMLTSPTKAKGRKSTAQRTSSSGTGAVVTRSSARRKH